MKIRQIITTALLLLCLFALTTPAFAIEDSIDTSPSTPTEPPEDIADYSLNDTVFKSREFLFIHRKGDPIIASGSSSSRIANDPDNQLATQADIWSTDQVELLDDKVYYVKVQFEYDYANYGDDELWLHIKLPKTTTSASTAHLSATLSLRDFTTNEIIAQVNQQISLFTPDASQELKFYPRFNYVSLPDLTTTTFQTADQLTSNENISILLPTTTSKGIILFDFRSDTTLPSFLSSSPPAAWRAELSTFPNTLLADKGNHINVTSMPEESPSAEPVETPVANEDSAKDLVKNQSESPNPIPPSTKIFGLRLPFSIDFNFQFDKILILKIVAYLVICAIVILVCLELRSRSIQRQRRIARAKRRREYDASRQDEIKRYQTELDHLFDDKFLDFDTPNYQEGA